MTTKDLIKELDAVADLLAAKGRQHKDDALSESGEAVSNLIDRLRDEGLKG